MATIYDQDGEINTNDQRSGLVHVEFDWSDEYGECYECGRPAAYALDYNFANDRGAAALRCSVCAALAASEGARITWLFAEDDES